MRLPWGGTGWIFCKEHVHKTPNTIRTSRRSNNYMDPSIDHDGDRHAATLRDNSMSHQGAYSPGARSLKRLAR